MARCAFSLLRRAQRFIREFVYVRSSGRLLLRAVRSHCLLDITRCR